MAGIVADNLLEVHLGFGVLNGLRVPLAITGLDLLPDSAEADGFAEVRQLLLGCGA
jgi:hypothetical protein